MKVGRLFCILNAGSMAFGKLCRGGAAASVAYEEVPGCAVAHVGWEIELLCAPFYMYENGGNATSLQMAG